MPASPAPPPPPPADVRARFAAAWDRAHRHLDESLEADEPPLVERLLGVVAAPPGFDVWRVGGEGGPTTAMPALHPDAPMEVRARYLARVVANCLGSCPMCGAVVDLPADAPDPRRTPAAWSALPLAVGIDHEPDCPAIFAEDERHWFPAVPR